MTSGNLELADNPDLAPEYEAGLREIHAKRVNLARRVGMAALGVCIRPA
jgi:hypothetical protein